MGNTKVATSLEVIAAAFSQGSPQNLKVLIEFLQPHEGYAEFTELVAKYFPEDTTILAAGDLVDQVQRFCTRFSEDFVEIDLDRYAMRMGDWDLESFVNWIPLELAGIEEDDIHSFYDLKKGLQLLTLLVDMGGHDVTAFGNQTGLRVSHLEIALEEKLVSKALLMRLPENGYTAAELHNRLNNTKYVAAATWADMLNHGTGNPFLDYTDMDVMEGSVRMDWGRPEDMRRLGEDQREARRFHDEIQELADWLEESPEKRFTEVVNFLEGGYRVPVNQLALPIADGAEVPMGHAGQAEAPSGNAAHAAPVLRQRNTPRRARR